MKKKVDKNALRESCYMMNISKTLTNIEGNTLSSSFSDDKISISNPLTPPQSVISSPNNKIKTEREISPGVLDSGEDLSSHGKSSPPLSSLGPGAEIKGKICHPIPSSSKLEVSEYLDVGTENYGTSGGRLAFYKEGKLLLELSHKSEQGSWVKVNTSKTFWPPPSTTSSAAIQHPLRHDTPTTHSDDCSSVNSSPWFTDHIRKQSGPNPKSKILISADYLFYIKNTPLSRSLRRKVRLRRNPYYRIVGPINSLKSDPDNYIGKLCTVTKDIKYSDRKKRLEKKISEIGKKVDLRLDDNLSIRSLFEGVENSNSNSSCESLDPNFVTPRKRYLRTLEADFDSHIRKKVHSSNMSPASSSHLKHCDRLSFSPLQLVPHKSAINSQNSSSYSIDSLLSNEPSEKKSESFLRNLLKSDKSRSSPHGRHNTSRDHSIIDGLNNHMKVERRGSPYLKERKEAPNDHKTILPERFDLSSNLSRFNPHTNFGGLYLNPYLDPGYMMLHSLSSTAPFLPNVTQPNDMASAVAAAAAAAAAAGYPLTPLHLSSLTANNLLPGGIGSTYAPATSLASQLIRSPTPNRSSPLSVPHSPSPKLSPALPNINLSPQVGIAGSPRSREVWTPSNSSPLKCPSTSSLSPPPQEVPLNLTKPKRN